MGIQRRISFSGCSLVLRFVALKRTLLVAAGRLRSHAEHLKTPLASSAQMEWLQALK